MSNNGTFITTGQQLRPSSGYPLRIEGCIHNPETNRPNMFHPKANRNTWHNNTRYVNQQRPSTRMLRDGRAIVDTGNQFVPCHETSSTTSLSRGARLPGNQFLSKMDKSTILNNRQQFSQQQQPAGLKSFRNFNYAANLHLQQNNSIRPSNTQPFSNLYNSSALIPNLPALNTSLFHVSSAVPRIPLLPSDPFIPPPGTPWQSFANNIDQPPPFMVPKYNFNVSEKSNEVAAAKDENIIKDWLQERKLEIMTESRVQKEKRIKLKEGYRMIAKYLDLIQELKTYHDTLEKQINTDTEKWTEIVNKSLLIKERLLHLENELFDSHFAKELFAAINNCMKRRERRKAACSRRSIEKQNLKQKTKIQHQRIDNWRHNILSEINAKKLSDSMKSEAGKSLIEVRRKQSESAKYLEKLTHIKQVRRLRRETALQRGILVFAKEDEKFENRIKELIKLTEGRLDVYKNEEKTLIVMLEEEKEQIQQKDDKEIRNLMRNEYLRLFGFDPLLECQRYWLQAYESPIGLTKIRRLWDSYIVPSSVPGADQIPDEWIKPQRGKNRSWNRYLNRDKR